MTTVIASSFSLFSGLCPVRIPADWVSDPDKVRWASKAEREMQSAGSDFDISVFVV